MGELILNIVTPNGACGPIICDSIHLTICERADGRGGGSYGIRAGHIKSLLSLEKGRVTAFLAGKQVFAADCGNGFATVENNTVTAVVEEYCEK